MKRPLLGAFLIIALSLGADAIEPGAKWSFHVSTMEDSSGEGPERDRPYITLGEQRIAFSQPSKSRFTSDPRKLTIHFPERELSGRIDVEESSFKPEVDFLVATDDYYQAAEALIPKEAEEIEFKGANTTTYAVNEWKCQVFEWSYSHYGRRFYSQVAYINKDPEHQIRLKILCLENEWKQTFPIAKRFMSSWYFASSEPKRYIK